MQQDECSRIFEKIFHQVNTNWERFIKKVRKLADHDDRNLIYMDEFMALLQKYKVEITSEERERLILVFPAREEESRVRLNIGKLYDQKYNMMLRKLY
jgi:vacuolar-type H+-ATPase subunit F/Vma7